MHEQSKANTNDADTEPEPNKASALPASSGFYEKQKNVVAHGLRPQEFFLCNSHALSGDYVHALVACDVSDPRKSLADY